MKPQRVFALDIGTRKVMGLWVQIEEGIIHVIDSEVVEHPTRSMSVGQIQDVPKVTQVVRQVVGTLEKRCGETFREVSVAVAGRNLKTIVGKAVLNCPPDRPIEMRDLERLTFYALEDALHRLSLEAGTDNEGETPYYCVGYAASCYRLDGDTVAHPVGHRGTRLELEVLATFLPRPVLESQIAVLEALGLKAESVTLEPIAALQATVDAELKNFDLALVDVGAGTSDIALVSGGAVKAFGMVPCAGDTITERICNEFLLDFQSAERIKRSALNGGVLEATNIFQRPLYLESSRVLAAMAPAVSELAMKISRCIFELGGTVPKAILCVGGGSLTPGLLEELADAMGIPTHCVGVRAPGGHLGLKDAQGRVLGPEAATPLGIACVAASEGGVRFKQIFLNNKRLYLLEMGKPLDVLAALMASGISAKKIFGWPGPSKTYTLNGEFRIFKSKPTHPAKTQIHGMAVDFNHPIAEGDRIEFAPAGGEENVGGTIAEAVGFVRRDVAVDGIIRAIPVRITKDGQPLDPESPLEDRMNLVVINGTLRDLLSEDEQQRDIFVNGRLATLDTALHEGDRVTTVVRRMDPDEMPGSDYRPAATRSKPISVRVNGKWLTLKDRDGNDLEIGKDNPPILVDALRTVSIGPSLAQVGKRLRLLINGQEAHFTSPLHDGADVKVFFE